MKIVFKRGHVPALDGLRGVAIILVLLSHFYRFQPFLYFSSFGWTGVDLFFVLSGFLITGILYDSKGGKNFYRNFIIKRVLRIFPLYYFVLTVFFVIDKISYLPEFRYYPYSELPFWTYTSNLSMAFNGVAKSGLRIHLEHFWSLAIEEQFYLFWPFCIMLFSTKNIIRVSVLLIIFSIAIKNIYPAYPFSYFFTFSRLEGLSIGSIIAILIRENKKILETWAIPIFVLSTFAILTTIVIRKNMGNGDTAFIKYGYTLIALMYGSILVISFALSKIGKAVNSLLNTRILRFFGKYSYGMYVYHWIFYSILYLQLKKISNFNTDIFWSKFFVATILPYHDYRF